MGRSSTYPKVHTDHVPKYISLRNRMDSPSDCPLVTSPTSTALLGACYTWDRCKVRLGAWSVLVWRWFFWCLSSHCLRRKWARLGPSLSIVYRVGTEGFLGRNWWCTDWEAWEPMQLQRGVRLGSRTTYAALWGSWFRSLDWYENSDLKSKWFTGTGYILLIDS